MYSGHYMHSNICVSTSFVDDLLTTISNISSRFSRNFEAFAIKFIESIEGIIIWYHIGTRREKSN